MAGFDNIIEIYHRNLSFLSVFVLYPLMHILILSAGSSGLMSTSENGDALSFHGNRNFLLQYHYIGCFSDNNNKSVPLFESFVSDKQSINLCIDQCIKRNTDYARLQNGSACYCVNDYGVQLSDDECNLPCNGSQCQYCGGDTRKHIAYVIYTVCPAGSYGSACDKVCHCKRQVPCNRITGTCPDGCHGNYTGQKCDEIDKLAQYIGCYPHVITDPALPFQHFPILNNSWQKCTELCASNTSSSYAGLQNKHTCLCGENYEKHGRLPESNCSTLCHKDRTEICGADRAMNVYSTCPAGLYGKSCLQSCNCLKNRRCVYADGSCPESWCAPGWTGRSCSNRDCGVQNGGCYSSEVCSTVDLNFTKITVCRCAEGYRRSKIWENCTADANTHENYHFIPKDESSSADTAVSAGTTSCGYSVNTVVGAAVGSSLASIAVTVLIVLLCRPKNEQKQKSLSKDTQNRKQINATPLMLTSSSDYEGLNTTSENIDESAYTELNVV